MNKNFFLSSATLESSSYYNTANYAHVIEKTDGSNIIFFSVKFFCFS